MIGFVLNNGFSIGGDMLFCFFKSGNLCSRIKIFKSWFVEIFCNFAPRLQQIEQDARCIK